MSHTCNGTCKDCGMKTNLFKFRHDFFDKPISPLEIAQLQSRALYSVKHHLRYKELPSANNSVVESRKVVNELKEEIKQTIVDIEEMNKMDLMGEFTGYAQEAVEHSRKLLHLQNLTLLQFKKKEVIYSWIYKGNKEEVEKRLTPYKVAMGECFEYYEEHSNEMGITIQLGNPTTTEGDYTGEKNKDENIRKIGEELQNEANKVENFYKICC